MREKYEELKKILLEMESVAVAYSSGVDSTFLLKVAVDVLGVDNVLAITEVTSFFPEREENEAVEFCKINGINHELIKFPVLTIDGIASNPVNRCYLCKKALFTGMKEVASKHNIGYVLEGSNVDDLGDYRPGLKAIDELGIKSPLREAGLTKQDIRALSKELGLPTWEKPSFACLASRFVYGQTITEAKLKKVDAAEQLLVERGFTQFRVRIHQEPTGDVAKIEVPVDDIPRLKVSISKDSLEEEILDLGFKQVVVDDKGYRTGSMNENIIKE